jgi:KaiC/GvpD/RAD55 family RecA-like ATPase
MKFGIPNLVDAIGELPERSNFLFITPPRPEKNLFIAHYVNEGLTSKQPAVYVTTDIAPSEIEARASSFGWKFSDYTNSLLWFVDCYSWALEKKPVERSDIRVSGPSSLDDLSLSINQATYHANKLSPLGRVAFQSLSTLLIYNTPSIIYKFCQVLGARLKSAGMTTLFMVEEGMHQADVMATLEHMMDGIIEVKFEEGRWFISSSQIRSSGKVELKITDKGVEVLR